MIISSHCIRAHEVLCWAYSEARDSEECLFDSSSQIQGQCLYGEQHLKSAYMNIMGQNNQLTELATICASVIFVIIYNAKGKLHQTGAGRHRQLL